MMHIMSLLSSYVATQLNFEEIIETSSIKHNRLGYS